MRRLLLGTVATLALLGGGLALGRATAPEAGSGSGSGGEGHHAGAPAGAAEAAVAPGPADVGFAQDMAVHHDQAVQMARLVRGRVDPRVDAIAASILEAQTRETGMLRGWLDLWGAPQLPSGAPMTWMDASHSHAGDATGDAEAPPMPGLASTAEMGELATLEGAALEARFLQLMVRHHRGGIEMAGAGADRAAVPAVRRAAQLMATEQHQEIALMLPLLREHGASELP